MFLVNQYYNYLFICLKDKEDYIEKQFKQMLLSAKKQSIVSPGRSSVSTVKTSRQVGVKQQKNKVLSKKLLIVLFLYS